MEICTPSPQRTPIQSAYTKANIESKGLTIQNANPIFCAVFTSSYPVSGEAVRRTLDGEIEQERGVSGLQGVEGGLYGWILSAAATLTHRSKIALQVVLSDQTWNEARPESFRLHVMEDLVDEPGYSLGHSHSVVVTFRRNEFRGAIGRPIVPRR